MAKLKHTLGGGGGAPANARTGPPREGMRDRRMEPPKVDRRYGERVFVFTLEEFRRKAKAKSDGGEGGLKVKGGKTSLKCEFATGRYCRIRMVREDAKHSHATIVVTANILRGGDGPIVKTIPLSKTWYGEGYGQDGYINLGDKTFEPGDFYGQGFVEIYLSKR